MEHLDILIPMAPNRFLPQTVLDHILIQNIPFRLFFTNAKGDGATSARNFVKAMWQSSPDKSNYTLMTDNDICLPKDLVRSMIDFLDQNSDFGALGVQRGGAPQLPKTQAMESPHVNAGPVLFRREIFEKLTYHNNNGCECQGMSDDIRNMGLRIGFIGGFTYDHVDQTVRSDLENPVSVIQSDEEENVILPSEPTPREILNCVQIGVKDSAEYTYLVGYQAENDDHTWKPKEYLPSGNWDYYGVDPNPLNIFDWSSKKIPNTKWINVFLAPETGIAETFEIDHIDQNNKSELGEHLFIGKITLSQLINDLKLDEIEILAIDVGGHELEIFYEYDWNIKPKYLIVKTYSDEIQGSIDELFTTYNYKKLENDQSNEIIYYHG